MGHDPVRREADFTSPPQGHPRGGRHDGDGGVFQLQEGVLELLNGEVDLLPVLIFDLEEEKHEVCSGGKVGGVIGDHEPPHVRDHPLDGVVDHGNDVPADSVHLRMKFEARHTVANIP